MAEITEFPSANGVNLLEEIFATLDEVEGTDEEGIKLFAAMLEMPEDKFTVVAPALLESFE